MYQTELNELYKVHTSLEQKLTQLQMKDDWNEVLVYNNLVNSTLGDEYSELQKLMDDCFTQCKNINIYYALSNYAEENMLENFETTGELVVTINPNPTKIVCLSENTMDLKPKPSDAEENGQEDATMEDRYENDKYLRFDLMEHKYLWLNEDMLEENENLTIEFQGCLWKLQEDWNMQEQLYDFFPAFVEPLKSLSQVPCTFMVQGVSRLIPNPGMNLGNFYIFF